MKKTVEILKKKWLRETSLTLILVAIIITIYFAKEIIWPIKNLKA